MVLFDAPVVLDASVAIKWFFVGEVHRDRALEVRDALVARPQAFVVPHLFYVELIHVLMRKSGQDAAFVLQALALIERLGMRTLGLPAAAMQRCVTWVAQGLTGYDATHVALAESLNGAWLTADEVAAARAGNLARTLLSC